MKKRNILLLSAMLSFTTNVAFSQNMSDSTGTDVGKLDENIAGLSLEDLLNVEVTSVSKKAEKLQNVASSIYVLSKDDITKSGATNFIELLRQVPGFWIPQSDYNTGLGNMRYSAVENGFIGSVLYLLDGTPIQDLMNSTVSFRNLDIPLDEIERIEIIKGSGGTIYGANSATGVVNIFTKNPAKYDSRLSVKSEMANPGYAVGQVRAGGMVTDKLAISGYAKFRNFNGYGLMKEFDGVYVDVPKNDGSGTTSILNNLTQDYQSQLMLSSGLKLNYKVNEKTNISANTHVNTLKKGEYSTVYPTEFYGQKNILFYNKFNSLRVTSNVKFSHDFNDRHSGFIRVSNNHEKDYVGLGGGYRTNNGIIDIEAQDNIKIGKVHDVSYGGNYRFVKFDVNHINDKNTINYLDAQSQKTLKGIFAQDKLTFLDSSLNVTLGVKAEQYTLVNDNFYFSPNIKVAYMPTDKITLWGGFTQSYTTPGYNMTNIDLSLLKVPTYGFYYQQVAPVVTSQVSQGVYQNVYNNAIAQGADAATADAQAKGYVASAAGQAAIAQTANPIIQNTLQGYTTKYPGTYTIGVKNGSKTVPTKFQTFEFGFRASMFSKVSLESNFFYTLFSDAIAPSNNVILTAVPSLTNAGSVVDYYTYGNYLKGTSVGNESVIKSKPFDFLTLEGSLAVLTTKTQYQSNPDFRIDSGLVVDQTPKTPTVPQFVWRFKTYVDLPFDFCVSGSVLYATTSNTDTKYQYEYQRFTPILGGSGTTIAPNKDRTILNLKIEKKFMDKKMSVYVFGNDILNKGRIEYANSVTSFNVYQTKAMYGVGLNYAF